MANSRDKEEKKLQSGLYVRVREEMDKGESEGYDEWDRRTVG